MERSYNAVYASLDDGERILWSGAASPGASIVMWQDIFLIPFSLVWGGGMIFGAALTLMALFTTKDLAMLFLVPVMVPLGVIGAYFSVGRLIFKSWRQHHCYYAITPRRVLIAVSGQVRAVFFRTIDQIDIASRSRTGIGTIRLGRLPWWVRSKTDDGMDIISLLRGAGVPTIWDIDNVDQVYGLIRTHWMQSKAGL